MLDKATMMMVDVPASSLSAVRAHAKQPMLAQRGRTWWRWHLAALAETLQEEEQLPMLHRAAVYLRTGERRVATSFTEFGAPETGRGPPL